MPNHIKNNLEIIGTKKEAIKVIHHLNGDPHDDKSERKIDFNKIKPMPEELNITSDSWISLLENQFSEGHLKKALDKYREQANFEYNDQVEESMDNFIQGIKNYLKYGSASWYGWASENWGTKWNAYSFGDKRDSETIVYFETAWAAPKELMRLLSEQFPDVKISLIWADEDTGYNAGNLLFHNGKEVEKNEPKGGSKEAYEIAFEMRPDYKTDYKLVDGQYEYVEEG